MTGLCRSLILGLALWLGAAACAVASEAAPSADTGQQIMVLLRLPSEHFRAGSSYSGAYGDGLGHSGRLRIAASLAQAHGLTLVDDWPMPVVGVECFVMRAPAGRSPAEEIASLARDRRVESAEAINIYQARSAPAAATHNDPLFRAQPAAQAWRLADLHQVATGRNVRANEEIGGEGDAEAIEGRLKTKLLAVGDDRAFHGDLEPFAVFEELPVVRSLVTGPAPTDTTVRCQIAGMLWRSTTGQVLG